MRQNPIFWTFLIAFLAIAVLTSCASVRVPNFKAHITLPASGDGYWVKTVSGEEGRIPKSDWELKRKRGVILLKEDWAILRNTVIENCLSNSSCTDIVGVFDGLFQSIDNALKKVKP